MNELSLKKDFLHHVSPQGIEFPELGNVVMEDIGAERRDDLRRFYDKNYRPGYILGNQELFNWMFKNNGGRVVVLSKNKEILAHQGHIPVVFTNGLKDYKGFISASTIVDADLATGTFSSITGVGTLTGLTLSGR